MINKFKKKLIGNKKTVEEELMSMYRVESIAQEYIPPLLPEIPMKSQKIFEFYFFLKSTKRKKTGKKAQQESKALF